MKYYVFECEDGRKYYAKEGQCLGCVNCIDVYYDFTHGPYMIVCKKGLQPTIYCNMWAPDKRLKMEEK